MAERKSGQVAAVVSGLAEPLCEKLGLMLWDVRFEKEGATWYLRVFIDKDEGINISDCEAFSREFNDILDETDPISQSYVFEVSGAGLGRDLKKPEHFLRFIGDEIRLKLYKSRGGRKETEGILKAYKDSVITVDIDGVLEDIPLSECAYIKLNDDKDLF